jgi:hypothetical protein
MRVTFEGAAMSRADVVRAKPTPEPRTLYIGPLAEASFGSMGQSADLGMEGNSVVLGWSRLKQGVHRNSLAPLAFRSAVACC